MLERQGPSVTPHTCHNAHSVISLPSITLTLSDEFNSPSSRKLLKPVREGIGYMKEEIDHINHYVHGMVEDIKKRRFFVKKKEKIDHADWILFKETSFAYATQEIIGSLTRLAEDLSPALIDFIGIIYDDCRSRDPQKQAIRQALENLYLAVVEQRTHIADGMYWVLERCIQEDKLSLVTENTFYSFSQYISRHGTKQTQKKLEQLCQPENSDSGLVLKIYQDANQGMIILPEGLNREAIFDASALDHVLPGSDVFHTFLPSQMYHVIQFNKRSRDLNTLIDQFLMPNLERMPLLKSLHASTSKEFSAYFQTNQFKQSVQKGLDIVSMQEGSLIQALNAVRHKQLKGWRAWIASLFKRNPNELLSHWKKSLETQRLKLVLKRIQLLKNAVTYLKAHHHPEELDFPNPDVIDMLKNLTTDIQTAMSDCSYLGNNDYVEEFWSLFYELEELTNVPHHFIHYLQYTQPEALGIEPKQKNGFTVWMPDSTQVNNLIAKTIRFAEPTVANSIKTLGQWLKGENLPASLADMQTTLGPLFADPNELQPFVESFIEKYIQPSICEVHSAAFQLLNEYNPKCAQDWVKKHQKRAEQAYLFLEKVLCEGISLKGEKPVVIQDQQVFVTVANLLDSVKTLHALDPAVSNQPYLKNLKQVIEELMQQEDTWLFDDPGYAELISEINEEALIECYGIAWLKRLLAGQDLGKVLVANEVFFKKQVQNTHLHTAIQHILSDTLKEPWNQFIQYVVEELGEETLQHAYRLRWFEVGLREGQWFNREENAKLLNANLDDIIMAYGEANIPIMIQRMTEFLDQEAPHEEGLRIIRHYVTPAFVARFNANALEEKLNHLIDKQERQQAIQDKVDTIVNHLTCAISTDTCAETQQEMEAAQNRIKHVLHNITFYEQEPEKKEENCAVMHTLLNHVNEILGKLSEIRSQHLKTIDSNEGTQSKEVVHTSSSTQSFMNKPPVPQPALWEFFGSIREGLNHLNAEDHISLLQHFQDICQNFNQLTQPIGFFVEKIKTPTTFSWVRRQANNGLFIRKPDERQVAELIEYMMQQPLSSEEASIVMKVGDWLLGDKHHASLDQWYQELGALFKHHSDPKASLEQFVPIFMKFYIEPALSSLHSPAYQLLAHYDPNAAKKWVESKLPDVEASLFFLKEILEQNVTLSEFSKPILCNGQEIKPTLEMIKIHVQRIRDFSTETMNYTARLQGCVQAHIQRSSAQSMKESGCHELITAMGDVNLIVGFGIPLFKQFLEQNQYDAIEHHPFFVANCKNPILQAALANVLAAHFKQHPEWNSSWVSLINYFNQDKVRFDLLHRLLISQKTWHPELHQLIHTQGNEFLKQAAQLKWFSHLVADASFARQYANDALKPYDATLLKTLYGEGGLSQVFQSIEKCIGSSTLTEQGFYLIQAYLTGDNVKVFQQEALQIKWREYAVTHLKNLEAQRIAADMIHAWEQGHYESAISKLKTLLYNIRIYEPNTEQHFAQQVILEELIQQLIKKVGALAENHSQQALAFLERYFIALLPASEKKDRLVALCRNPHPSYRFDSTDQLTFTLYQLLTTQLQQLDEQIFAALSEDYFSSKAESAEQLKLLRDRMVAKGISQVHQLSDISPKEERLLKAIYQKSSFFQKDCSIEVVLNCSARAHLLLKSLGKASNARKPIVVYLDALKTCTKEMVQEVKQKTTTHTRVKELLLGVTGDGFLCEIPDLLVQYHHVPSEKVIVCETLRAEWNSTNNIHTLEQLADALFSAKRYHQAILCYHTLIQHNVRNSHAHYQRALAKFYTEKYEEMLAESSIALKYVLTDSHRNNLIYYCALAHEQLKQFDQASKEFSYLKRKGFKVDAFEQEKSPAALLAR